MSKPVDKPRLLARLSAHMAALLPRLRRRVEGWVPAPAMRPDVWSNGRQRVVGGICCFPNDRGADDTIGLVFVSIIYDDTSAEFSASVETDEGKQVYTVIEELSVKARDGEELTARLLELVDEAYRICMENPAVLDSMAAAIAALREAPSPPFS